MGLFFNKRPKVVVNLVVQQEPQQPPPPPRKKIRLTYQQSKLLKEGAVIDAAGNMYPKETVWIPDEPWNEIYHGKDFCCGKQCGTPYIEFEAVRRGLRKCPYCFSEDRPERGPAVTPRMPTKPLDHIKNYDPNAELI